MYGVGLSKTVDNELYSYRHAMPYAICQLQLHEVKSDDISYSQSLSIMQALIYTSHADDEQWLNTLHLICESFLLSSCSTVLNI